jgi:hypothetical protein
MTRPEYSTSKQAIYAVLKAAAEPLIASQIAEQSGVSLSLVRTHLGHGMARGDLINLHPNTRSALYVWGCSPSIQKTPPTRFVPSGRYDGADLLRAPVRIGAGDALEVPSRRGEELVRHRGPISLAGSQ